MPVLKASNRIIQDERFSLDKNKEWSGPFFFIQGSDSQLGLTYNWGNDGTDGVPYPDSKWDVEMKLAKLAVQKMNTMSPKPAFFIMCGDYTDAFPDEWPNVKEKQLADYKKAFLDLDPSIPILCACGNCDIAQEAWLNQVLEMDERKNAKHTIIFQHIPWFFGEIDEEEDYFNIGYEMRIKKLDQFYAAGIRKIFCGHLHKNAGGVYKDLEVVVTSAIGCQLGQDQNGMRVVTVTEETIEHEYYSLDDFPTKINM